jgi:hypothetical protein
VNNAARKARKRAGISWSPKDHHGPRFSRPAPSGIARPLRDVHGYIRLGLWLFLIAGAGVAGYLIRWATS